MYTVKVSKNCTEYIENIRQLRELLNQIGQCEHLIREAEFTKMQEAMLVAMQPYEEQIIGEMMNANHRQTTIKQIK
tara:strand:+ start:437 stop:664 length:228 start_codon:yes stop_codon:yes gene_type:complete